MPTRMTTAQDGFTILELVAVIVLLGILAIATIPRIDFNAGKTPLSSDVVYSDIAYTQLTAMNQNRSLCITLVTGSPTYEFGAAYCPVSAVATANCPITAVATCTAGTGTTRTLTDLGSNITVSVGAPGGVLAFNSLGEPYGLAVATSVTVTDGITPQTVTVQPVTGKVSVP